MAEARIGDVRPVPIARIGGSVASTSKSVSFGSAEGLALEEHAAGADALQRHETNRRSITIRRLDVLRLKAKVVHSGDRCDVCAGGAVDGWIAFVGPIGDAVEVVAVDLDMEGLLDSPHRALDLDVH